MSIAEIATSAGVPYEAVDVTAKWEGCLKKVPGQDAYKAYYCPAHVPTIGRGTTEYNDQGGRKVRIDDPPITQARADELLAYDLGKVYSPPVRRAVKTFQTNNQYAACISFAYNVGTYGFAKSTLCWLINQGRYADAAREFAKWNRGGGRVLPGLVNRRADEARLFLRPGAAYSYGAGVTSKEIAPAPRPVVVQAPSPATGTSTVRTWWRWFWS